MFYKLDGKKAVLTSNFEDLIGLFDIESDKRIVRRTYFEDGRWLSTVFLVYDHGYSVSFGNPGVGNPILFETMVFDDPEHGDEVLERYCTWEEAEKGHEQIVQRIVSLGTKVVKDEIKKNSLEDDFEEIDRFELLDFD